MRRTALMSVALLSTAILTVGCYSDSRSSGRAEYTQRQEGANVSGPQKAYHQAETRMGDLKEQIQTHFELYTKARRLNDPFEMVQAKESARFGKLAAVELETLCESTLSTTSIIRDVSGAESSIEEYLAYARKMKGKFQDN